MPTATLENETGTDAGNVWIGPVLQMIALKDLSPSPLNPRKHVDTASIEELARTMEGGRGVVEPLIARPKGRGYEIVAGERRWRAAAYAQLAEVPVIVRPLTDVEALQMMVIENDHRRDLNPLEEADGFKRLVKFGVTVDDLAARISHPAKYIVNRIKLLSLEPAAQALLREGRITAAHGVLLSRLTPAQQKAAIDPEVGGLFRIEGERGLFRPDGDHKAQAEPALRTVSTRELEGYINEHCRLDVSRKDLPELFPETAEELAQAERVVHVTFERYVYRGPDAPKGEKLYTYENEWKRADGKKGSKACPKAVTGVHVLGPGRGDAFKVCIDTACKVHWSVRKAAAPAVDTPSPSLVKYQKQRQQEAAARRRFKAAVPRILEAAAARVKTANPLALLEVIAHGLRADYVKAARKVIPGKTAADALRAFALAELMTVGNDYGAERLLPKLGKTFGLNVAPLLRAPAKSRFVEAVHKAAAKAGVKARPAGTARLGPPPLKVRLRRR